MIDAIRGAGRFTPVPPLLVVAGTSASQVLDQTVQRGLVGGYPLLAEFMLLYSNDWCLVPLELDLGTFTRVHGMLVTDVFGEQTLVRPADRGRDSEWQRWSMFRLSGDDVQAASLLLAPALTNVLEAPPAEVVNTDSIPVLPSSPPSTSTSRNHLSASPGFRCWASRRPAREPVGTFWGLERTLAYKTGQKHGTAGYR